VNQEADAPEQIRWRAALAKQVIIVFACIVLGGVSSVLVAWDIARKGPDFADRRSGVRWSSAEGPAWLYQREESLGAVRVRGQFASAWAAGRRASVAVEAPPAWSTMSQRPEDDPVLRSRREEAFGWPQPALMSEIIQPQPGFVVQVIDAIDLGPHPRQWGVRLYLPTRPIWRGMIVNTIFYGCLWWIALSLLIAASGMLRALPAALRRRRGRCPRCGYDLRGRFDEGCSECGWRRTLKTEPQTNADEVR
jgi:hypothetical protein